MDDPDIQKFDTHVRITCTPCEACEYRGYFDIPRDEWDRQAKHMEKNYQAWIRVNLAEIMKEEAIDDWLTTPNPAFDGLTPQETLDKGEHKRFWAMIHYLRSGEPS